MKDVYLVGGNGRMGGAIQNEAKAQGAKIKSSYDVSNFIMPDKKIDTENSDYHLGQLIQSAYKNNGVIIDFTTAEAFMKNIYKYTEVGNNILVGTTGWFADEKNVSIIRNLVEDSNSRLIYAGNFSLGVASFYEAVRTQAKWCNLIGGFEVAIYEVHHTKKLDAPSGTSKELEKIIKSQMPGKQKVMHKTIDIRGVPFTETIGGFINCGNFNKHGASDSFKSISARTGDVFGYHKVIFYDGNQTIVLEHNSESRNHFASGVLKAADWLTQQEFGKIYTMTDFLNSIQNHPKTK